MAGADSRKASIPTGIKYFVDLMTASLEGHLDVMVRELATHMRNSRELDGITTIASPKRGNSLLLAGVAKELGLAPVFVKERPLYGTRVAVSLVPLVRYGDSELASIAERGRRAS